MASKVLATQLDRIKDCGKAIAVRDLAKLAQVDASTVSRALRHDPRVNE